MKVAAKEISGYHGYFVTSEGQIFHEVHSCTINGKTQRGRWWRRLTPDRIWCGYFRITLAGKNFLVHRLVALAFLPKPDWANEVNHIDGNKSHNAASNLEWSTRSLNLKHAFKIGLCSVKRGEDNRNSKLTEKEVIEIKIALKNPYLGIIKELGKKYGITPEAVSAIRHEKNWKHILVSGVTA